MGSVPAESSNTFGYMLVVVSTLAGDPLIYALVPANTDEWAAAEAVLFEIQGCDILADKGFLAMTGKTRSPESRAIVSSPLNAAINITKSLRPLPDY